MKRKRFLKNLASHQWLSAVVLALGVLFVASNFNIRRPASSFDVHEFGRLPVLNGGRIKPLDSVARTSLLLISGKQTVRTSDGKKSANEWLLDTLFHSTKADAYDIFQIDDPDVLGLFGIQQSTQRRYSFNDLRMSLMEIENQARRAEQVNQGQRSRFESSILSLYGRLMLYHSLQNTLQSAGQTDVAAHFEENSRKLAEGFAQHVHGQGAPMTNMLQESADFFREVEFLMQLTEFFPIPELNPTDEFSWISVGEGLLLRFRTDVLNPVVRGYAEIGDAYRNDDAPAFNAALKELHESLDSFGPKGGATVNYEFFYNHAKPFYVSIVLYVFVFLMVLFYLLFEQESLRRSAYLLMVLAFVVHTFGLVSRMVIQGRPPVTNLYSSAVFVGWGSVLMGLILERWFRRGIGTVVASFIGFTTLIVAHNLATQGDTLEMMRAVLDSNFWLATHVITITIGYSSTFISGIIGAVFLIRRIWDKNWNQESADLLFRMVYGVVCFNVFFSFLGTILGGIWADQSWGRFWGWDPKENGALMIFLWNAFILHARLSKYFGQTSIMVMAVFGNIITALSWFGVNMLGIGLHSYGFMDKALVWLLVFVASQAAIMALGWVPAPKRRSTPAPPQSQ